MTFSFDLISDLHVETWPTFNWRGQATSPYCVVAGDVCRDRTLLVDSLTHLGQCYPGGVFYIDGNDEHRHQLNNLETSYDELTQQIKNIKNVVYMQDNAVIINGVGFLATNGWWTYDFDPTLEFDQSLAFVRDRYDMNESAARDIIGIAYRDAAYLMNGVKKLQTHSEVKAIVIISHTVPGPWLVSHDLDLINDWRFNSQGNTQMGRILLEDTENKIKIWCFGHYHKSVDRDYRNIRYVSNPRGRGDTEWCQPTYYPKRITVNF
jgi:hypothetical protein